MKHIAIDYDYRLGEKNITHCGAIPKDAHGVLGSPQHHGECPACIDLHYQEHPNCNPYYNPYFCAHNPEGNSKLRKIKVDKLKRQS